MATVAFADVVDIDGGGRPPPPPHTAEDDDESVQDATDAFIDDIMYGPPELADDLTTARAAELATDPETARVLALAMSTPPVRSLIDRILSGDFPPWVRPVSMQTRSPDGVTLDDGSGLPVGDGHDVLLADGTTYRGAVGDGVVVHAVEFLPGTPPPGARRSKASMTRASLAGAVPSREAIIAAARKSDDNILAAWGIVASIDEEGTDANASSRIVRRKHVRARTSTTTLNLQDAKTPTVAAPDVMGEPEGAPPPECAALAAEERPIVAVRKYEAWLRTARRDASASMTKKPWKNEVSTTTDHVAEGRAFAFEVRHAHADEYEGTAAAMDDGFDNAPDPYVAPPNRAEAEASKEAALERSYRARSRDPEGVRWAVHSMALRDGVEHFPGIALDVVEAAVIAERVLSFKAAKFAHAHPDASRAEVHDIKMRQAAVHSLAALAALATRGGATEAAQSLEALMGGGRHVSKAYVDTLDLLPELRTPPPSRAKAKARANANANANTPPTATAPPGKKALHKRNLVAPTLVRWGGSAAHPLPKANTIRAVAQTRDIVDLSPPPKNGMLRAAAPIDFVYVPSAVSALLTAKRLGGANAELLLQQDASWLDHVARRRIPLMMPDPALRSLLLADAASRPPLPPHFDAASARRAGAYSVARALHLPLIAIQLGGSEVTVGALRAAFARAHAIKNGADAVLSSSPATFPAPKLRASEYERFERADLIPWIERALECNAPRLDKLKASLSSLRQEDMNVKNAALDALEPGRYRAVAELQRIGAFDDAAFARLAAEVSGEGGDDDEVKHADDADAEANLNNDFYNADDLYDHD